MTDDPVATVILDSLAALREDVRGLRAESITDHQAVRGDLAALTRRVELVETADQAEAARAASRRRVCRHAAVIATGSGALAASIVSVLVGTGVLP